MDCVENIKNQSIDHPEIIIIGAGIAGIAAGNQLMKEGFSNFKIFEASDRIGGRIWTIVTGKYLYTTTEFLIGNIILVTQIWSCVGLK